MLVGTVWIAFAKQPMRSTPSGEFKSGWATDRFGVPTTTKSTM